MNTDLRQTRPKPRLPPEAAAELSAWLAAVRWRRAVQRALRPIQLTFTQWQVLLAIQTLVRETGEAVSNSAVAVWCELDRVTVSQVMQALERHDMLDREPDQYGVQGSPYRTLLSPRGNATLRNATRAVATASRDSLAGKPYIVASASAPR